MSGSTPTDVLNLTTDPAAAFALMGDSNRVVRDDFAGPGGWSTGIADLLKAEDLTEVALEWDAAACLTRVANGHTNTLRADVAAYPVTPFLGRTVGYIGSPPCQTFSMAGGGTGRAHVDLLCAMVRGILLGRVTYEVAMARLEAAGALDDKDGNPDPRNGLILIPARVIRALLDHDGKGPTDLEWVALEQVPPAGQVFDAYAMALHELGFSVAAPVLNAADYGVPQTRERIFVLASRVRTVTVPEPTHVKGGEEPDLFGAARIGWVSMARALGWGMTARPYVTVAGGNPEKGGPDKQAVGGKGGRETIAREHDEGRWRIRDSFGTPSDDYPGRQGSRWKDPAVVPSPTVTSKTKDWAVEEAGRFLLDRRQTGEGSPPRQNAPGSLRITEAEGAILQGFPADYSWEGATKGKRWEQIGNVVCPPVARRVVAELLGVEATPLPWHAYAWDKTLT